VSRFYSTAVRVSLSLGLSGLVPFTSRGQSPHPQDLTEASLEDLMNIQVTSVSKKEQKLSRAGAAVYVITQDDIHRSGATNIPDLLRMVPGVHVAQIDASTWAISIRGFTDRYGDKVLVLIDGRSVYSPLTSGVDWDQQDVPLEDIERIEVIRGPGGTVWGANAVNGVINIMTKSARATRGGLVSAGAGSRESAQGLAQYGAEIGHKGAYRFFGNYSTIGNSPPPNDETLKDGGHKSHGGFRSDWDLSQRDTMTLQGDILNASAGHTIDTVLSNDLPREALFNDRTTVNAGNLLGRWNHTFSNGSDTSLQTYYDRYNRLDQGSKEIRYTFDLDFEHHMTLGSRHDIVWGIDFRVTSDNVTPGYSRRYVPSRRTDNLFGTFLQDEIKINNSLWLTIGSKFEHNAYTGFEYEPSAQLVWTPTGRQAIWMSASRAIRQPARADFGLRVDVAIAPLEDGGFGVVELIGTRRKAERLHDFEAGYRVQVKKQFSFDIAAFSSYYLDLQTQEPQPTYLTADPAPLHVLIPAFFDDQAHGHTYGGEIFANWSVTRRWRVSPGYSFIHMKVAGYPSSQDPGAGAIVNNTPKHQYQVHSFLDLTRHVNWDASFSYSGALPDGGAGVTAGYNRIDTRLGWRIGESVELSIVGQNLLAARHAEFFDTFRILHGLVARSVFGRVTWRF
jgi:iron complex outermembrane receptor protein